MIIPSQHASRVARAATGGGGGVTPNAVNWADVGACDGSLSGGSFVVYSQMLQITGITSTITLRVGLAVPFGSPSSIQRSVQSSASFGIGTTIANNGTFTVSNNQYVGFMVAAGSILQNCVIFTITNVSNNNVVLDTFRLSAWMDD